MGAAWIPAAYGIGQGLSSLLGSQQAGKDRAERKREFDLEFGLKNRQYGDLMASRQLTDPTRRAIIQALAQRFGLELPSSFFATGRAPEGAAPAPAVPPVEAPPPDDAARRQRLTMMLARFGMPTGGR